MSRIVKTLCVVAALWGGSYAQAQSLGDFAKGIAKKANEAVKNNSIVNTAVDVIGLNKVSEKSLQGTWSYEEPAVVLESKNVLNKVGGGLVTSSIEEQMGKQLARYGFHKGKMTFLFKSDKTFTATLNGKAVTGKYSLEGANLTLSRSGIGSVKANVKHSGKSLQIAVPANKVIALVQAVGNTAAKVDPQIQTLTELLQQYNGMYLGIKFKASK